MLNGVAAAGRRNSAILEREMPLSKGYSRKTVSKNISTLWHEGYRAKSGKQAVAIALSMARRSAQKSGRKPSYLFRRRKVK